MWIRNLGNEHMIFAINNNSSDGAMLRGSAQVTPGMNITYTAYYSVRMTNSQLSADRRAGGRASLFFPNKRVEVGVSYSKVLSDQRYSMAGADLTLTLKKIPFYICAKGIPNATIGKGYFVE